MATIGQFGNFKLAAFMMWDRALSTAEISTVTTYLTN
jgi:hypothetical protein